MTCDDLFEYKKTDSGYEIMSYRQKQNPDITEITIPFEYDGEPVTGISFFAFKRAVYIRRVHFPESVSVIRERAFWYAESLEKIILPRGITYLGDRAFGHCSAARTVEIPEGIKTIGSRAFKYCGITSAVLPKSVERVEKFAFEGCRDLESVVFLNPAVALGRGVFFDCPKLPAETVLASIVRSFDITKVIYPSEFRYPGRQGNISIKSGLFREDVFALAVKNDCFRILKKDIMSELFTMIIRGGLTELLRIAGTGGMLSDAELIDELTALSSGLKSTECTAWLLDYKNRKIGFKGEDDYEL